MYNNISTVERLHSARLERERIIEEQQLEQQQTRPRKAQQRDKKRPQSVTSPTPISKDRKTSAVTNSVLRETITKSANPTGERFTRSATLPMSDISRPSTSTRLPSVVMSLPEKVVLSLYYVIMMGGSFLLQDQRILQALAQKLNSEQEQEEIRKLAAQLWHEEALLEQASKQVLERQRREQLEQQKRANQMKVNGTKY